MGFHFQNSFHIDFKTWNTSIPLVLCEVLPLEGKHVKTSVAASTSENSADSDQHANSSQEGVSELTHNPTGPLQSSPVCF